MEGYWRIAVLVFLAAALLASPAAAAVRHAGQAWSASVRGLVLSIASDGERYVVVGTGWGNGLAYGGVYVFDASTGALLWNTTTSGGVSSVAVVSGCFAAASVDGLVYIKCPGEGLVEVNVSNLYPRLGMRVYWPLIGVNGAVVTEYAVTNLKLSAASPLFEFGVEALSTRGEVLWSFNTSNFVTALAASPNGTLVAAGDHSGVLYLYNTETGNLTTVRLWHPIHSLAVGNGVVYAYTYDGLLYTVTWSGRVENYLRFEGAAAPGRLLAGVGGAVVVGTARTSYLLDELNATKFIHLVAGGSGSVYMVSGGSTLWGRGGAAFYWVTARRGYVAAVGGVGGPSTGFNATVVLLNETGGVVFNETLPGSLALSTALVEPAPGQLLLVYGVSPYGELNGTSTVMAEVFTQQATATSTSTTTTAATGQPLVPVGIGVVALVVLLVVVVFVLIPLWLQSHHG